MEGFEEHRKDWESNKFGGQPRTPILTPEQRGRQMLLGSQPRKPVGGDDQLEELTG